ncbi:transposase [Thermoproteus tenax]|uniref:Transposase DNA-binding domain n=1 Tax=Thermoproteus tenax (strain ATCC 35583 / DSM 2078 / JCM 9277 / NBRC 100435 / Kra 1) TaxID=768679 RepID=G4RJJ4_THETK|nr:transposase [Thermoproteus tenax]CCC81739.1 transposase DNA-binding domain [Thermoproteus tenax Kra 1]
MSALTPPLPKGALEYDRGRDIIEILQLGGAAESTGLYVCRKLGVALNADVNAARNIAARVGHKTPVSKKIEAYRPASGGLKPPQCGPRPLGRRARSSSASYVHVRSFLLPAS